MILCLALFAGMLALLETGFRMARRFQTTRGDDTTAIFDTAVFALLGLLLGFAFSGGVDRLNNRRDLIVAEANAIGTAYLRVGLLPPAQQAPVRALDHAYLSALLAGEGMARNGERRVVHAGIFAAAVSLTVYTILDLGDPRGGLIRMDAAERALASLASEI